MIYDPEKVAEHEISWWQAHHRKDRERFLEHKTEVLEIEYGVPREIAEKAVTEYMAAAKEHDIAEELEDGGNQAEANKHWQGAKRLLTNYFGILHSRR